MVDKKKRKHLPPRGDPASKGPIVVPLVEREEFGENTFAGALRAVKGVIESVDKEKALKPGKKQKI
jgi:hypothetical protein